LNFKNLFFKENFIKLTNYGLQRMPGDVVLGLFIALPTFIATNYFSIIEAGNIAFCISLFNIIIAFMSPINIILLPKASKIVFYKDFVQLKRIGGKLLALALSIGIFSIIAINFLAEFVLNIFSISAENNTALYLKIVFTGVIGYSVFSIIRSIIDAFYAKAKNTVNISISFIFFIVSLFTLKFLGIFTLTNTLIVFSISINFLGVITYYSLVKINKLV
jgi:O-antigen/teichoic acid export membrane protein